MTPIRAAGALLYGVMYLVPFRPAAALRAGEGPGGRDPVPAAAAVGSTRAVKPALHPSPPLPVQLHISQIRTVMAHTEAHINSWSNARLGRCSACRGSAPSFLARQLFLSPDVLVEAVGRSVLCQRYGGLVS